MKPGDAIVALEEAMGRQDVESADFMFDQHGVCLRPAGLAEVLRWAAAHPEQAESLARSLNDEVPTEAMVAKYDEGAEVVTLKTRAVSVDERSTRHDYATCFSRRSEISPAMRRALVHFIPPPGERNRHRSVAP